jgi:hypothetical protein
MGTNTAYIAFQNIAVLDQPPRTPGHDLRRGPACTTGGFRAGKNTPTSPVDNFGIADILIRLAGNGALNGSWFRTNRFGRGAISVCDSADVFVSFDGNEAPSGPWSWTDQFGRPTVSVRAVSGKMLMLQAEQHDNGMLSVVLRNETLSLGVLAQRIAGPIAGGKPQDLEDARRFLHGVNRGNIAAAPCP